MKKFFFLLLALPCAFSLPARENILRFDRSAAA